MSAPTVDSTAPKKAKNPRKRALSTSAMTAPTEGAKPAKRAKANTFPNGDVRVDLTGPFDLLYTHPTFVKEYSQDGKDTTRPEALYKMLLARQEENPNNPDVWTAQITIPANYQAIPIREDVEFKNECIIDPMQEMPFDVVASHFKDVTKPTFKTKHGRPTVEDGAWNGAGLKAALKLPDGGPCGVSTASGTLALRPLWRKVGEDGKVMELFEGNFTFKAKFNSMYSKSGFGKGVSYSAEFWAIRGKK